MIEEDYVSFETAKLLKEKGFDEPTTKSYYTTGFENPMIFSHDLLPCIRLDEFLCPTHQMVMKWLREEHNLFVSIYTFDYQFDSYGWMFLIKPLRYTEGIGWCWDTDHVQEKKWSNDKVYKTYEEACEGAIQHCLENLV